MKLLSSSMVLHSGNRLANLWSVKLITMTHNLNLRSGFGNIINCCSVAKISVWLPLSPTELSLSEDQYISYFLTYFLKAICFNFSSIPFRNFRLMTKWRGILQFLHELTMKFSPYSHLCNLLLNDNKKLWILSLL